MKMFRLFLTMQTVVSIVLAAGLPVYANLIAVESTLDATGRVWSIDTGTGSATLIGNSGVAQLQNLAMSSSGTLYATAGANAQTLNTINPSTAAASPIGATSNALMSGLAFDQGGTLYGVGRETPAGQTNSLYSINLTTGARTLIGSTNTTSVLDMAFSSSGTLYGWSIAPTVAASGLRTIDTATGNSTFVGPIGGSLVTLQSLTFDQGGTLWGTTSDGDLYSVNPVTGAPTLRFTGLPLNLRGLAPLAPVPVPAALWLFGSGLAAMIGFARRRILSER